MSENLSVGSLLEKTGQWMQTVDGNEDRDSGFFFFNCSHLLSVYLRVCACTHIYSIQRSKDSLQELVISFFYSWE